MKGKLSDGDRIRIPHGSIVHSGYLVHVNKTDISAKEPEECEREKSSVNDREESEREYTD